MCPVRALRYYLDRTKDLRGSQSVLFISFKKGHTSDIRPATLSSWLKQTILRCYKQADQQFLDLVQVKAHDIRVFGVSKASYGGVLVDQIMQACHWKAQETFTNFYLKDLTWSNNENNMYLGPVVTTQQILDPSQGSRYMATSSGCLVRCFIFYFIKTVFNMCNVFCVSPGDPIISLLVFHLVISGKDNEIFKPRACRHW